MTTAGWLAGRPAAHTNFSPLFSKTQAGATAPARNKYTKIQTGPAFSIHIDCMTPASRLRRLASVLIIQIQFWDHIWNLLIKTNLLDLQHVSGIVFFWGGDEFHNIFEILSPVRKPKRRLWGKWHCFVIHIPRHGISSENLEKVEFGAIWEALLILITLARACCFAILERTRGWGSCQPHHCHLPHNCNKLRNKNELKA